MAVKITITCDTPDKTRPGPSMAAEYRCYSSFNDNVHGYFEGSLNDVARAYEDLRKLANTQGWRDRGHRIFCPGCVRRGVLTVSQR